MAAAEGQNKRALSEADIVQHVLPSVVNITVWKAATQPNSSGAASKEDETKPLEQFYGSGFVVDSSGLILTNRHVVDNAQDISVTFSNGDRARATLCAVSAIVDLAMVKVTGPGDLPAAIWGDSDQLRVGDLVLAIGNPLGVGLSVSSGIISALHRHVSASPFDDFIQTDASINHGNSGGALVDAAGAIALRVGPGFAEPVQTVDIGRPQRGENLILASSDDRSGGLGHGYLLLTRLLYWSEGGDYCMRLAF